MSVKYDEIDLFGKRLFSYVRFGQTVQSIAPMPESEACISYIEHGTNEVFTENESLTIIDGQAMLSKCGNYVSKMQVNDETEVFSAITVHFHKEVLAKIYEDSFTDFLKKANEPAKCSSVKIGASHLIQSYFSGIKDFFETKHVLSEDLLVLKLKEIILLLLKAEDAPMILNIMESLFVKRVFSFKEVIENHICSGLSLTELAGLTGHSLSTFKREFRKIYNDTPKKYIVDRRLNKVIDLLEVSDYPIGHIAYDCGFQSLSNLSKVFKTKFGKTPTQYRLDFLNK